jgi:hypothetical protein
MSADGGLHRISESSLRHDHRLPVRLQEEEHAAAGCQQALPDDVSQRRQGRRRVGGSGGPGSRVPLVPLQEERRGGFFF